MISILHLNVSITNNVSTLPTPTTLSSSSHIFLPSSGKQAAAETPTEMMLVVVSEPAPKMEPARVGCLGEYVLVLQLVEGGAGVIRLIFSCTWVS